MALASAIQLEFVWQGDKSFGRKGEFTRLDLKFEGNDEEIFLLFDQSVISNQCIPIHLNLAGRISCVADRLECLPALISSMKMTASRGGAHFTKEESPVLYHADLNFEPGATYQIFLKVEGSTLQGFLKNIKDNPLRQAAVGSLFDSLKSMGKVAKAAATPLEKWDALEDKELKECLLVLHRRYGEMINQIHENAVSDQIPPEEQVDLIKQEIASLRMTLERRGIAFNISPECIIS